MTKGRKYKGGQNRKNYLKYYMTWMIKPVLHVVYPNKFYYITVV